MKYHHLPMIVIFLLLFLTGCSVLQGFAPAPESSPIPSPTVPILTPTTEPTPGDLQYLNAVYCRISHIDEAEFNLIRFFPSGNLIDVFVQGYANCDEAWQASAAYLIEDNLMNFSHGEYQLSQEWITFTLAAPNSQTPVGEVKGTYTPGKMLLTRQGSEESEYLIVNMGD